MEVVSRGVGADVRTVRSLLGAARDLPVRRREAAVHRAAEQLARCARGAGQGAWARLAERLLRARGERLAGLVDSALAELASAEPDDGPASRGAQVLVVEGDPALGAVLGLALDEPGRASSLATGVAAARAELDAGAFDVVVASIALGRDDARDLLAWMRASPRHELTPVVLCGAEPTAVAECHALGADVVLPEPTAPDVLAACVGHLVRRARRERSLRQVDGATGLLNEAGMRAAFDRARAACARRHRPCALARIDVPDADDVEALTRQVARRVENVLRRGDVVGRIGPGSLVVLMPETDPAAARHATGRLEVHAGVDGLVVRIEPLRPTDAWTDVLARAGRAAG